MNLDVSVPHTSQTPVPSDHLVKDQLVLMGSAFEADDRVSWLPPSARGWQSSNAYLLIRGSHRTLLDPGLRYHAPVLIDQLHRLGPPETAMTVALTRSERDSAGCLRQIASAFPVTRLYAMGTPNMYDGFEAAVTENLPPGHAQDLLRLPTGDVPLGDGTTLTGIASLFRLLSTFWFFDPTTKSLFTSDAFTFLLGETPEEARTPAREPDDTWPDVDEVRAHTLAKFWWFENAHVSAIIRDVRKTFSDYPVERICPARGRVIEGRRSVEHALDLQLSVLDTLRQESRVEMRDPS